MQICLEQRPADTIPTNTVVRAPNWYRKATWKNRLLPDFIVIGAQKSGTTSLFDYLRQHHQLLPSVAKAVHYFDGGLDPRVNNFAKGETWYRSHFPLKYSARAGQKTFEATPLYMFHPFAAERIHDLVPDTKIIAMMRNPTERAISHYFHERRKPDREPLSIYDAFRQEERRLANAVRLEQYSCHSFIHHSYKSRGRYEEQIVRYLRYFPMKNIHMVRSEDLFAKPERILREVFEFLGVDPNVDLRSLHPRNVAKNKETVSQEIREYLDDYFQLHNRALYDLVGRDFGW